jgi:hypothetical protein
VHHHRHLEQGAESGSHCFDGAHQVGSLRLAVDEEADVAAEVVFVPTKYDAPETTSALEMWSAHETVFVTQNEPIFAHVATQNEAGCLYDQASPCVLLHLALLLWQQGFPSLSLPQTHWFELIGRIENLSRRQLPARPSTSPGSLLLELQLLFQQLHAQ